MPNQKMNHNPIECAKCGRGKHIQSSRAGLFSYFVCCKTAAQKAKPLDDKPDPELAAARADRRQMDLPL